jgi:6-pyruvoyltetrahydropterin/6-carboxytetrahydropterin synthase
VYEVEISVTFSAAHRLRDYNGKCERLHGHNYRIRAAARADKPGKGGMVIDFGDLKAVVHRVVERFDHAYLNEIAPFDEIEPSAENLAGHLFQEIADGLGPRGGLLHSVSVYESDTSRATYYRD